MGLLGVAFIVFGVILLVLVDGSRFTRVGLFKFRARGTSSSQSPIRHLGGAQGPASLRGREGAEPPPEYRGLAPGWYRDTADPVVARYWDGTRLSDERRPIAATPRPEHHPSDAADQEFSEASYRGLAPGWYRDPADPVMARYWDGTRLSDERRPVAEAPETQHVST